MNDREANWYSHPPTCSCADCTRKRLEIIPKKNKSKKAQKKFKNKTKINPDEWSRLMRAIKQPERQPSNATAEAKAPQPGGTASTIPECLLKKCPACHETSLSLNDSGNLYECLRCGSSYLPRVIDKTEDEAQGPQDAGKKQ